MSAIVYMPEIPTVYTVRDRVGNIVEYYVEPGSRIGIPSDLEIISETPAAPNMLRGDPNQWPLPST